MLIRHFSPSVLSFNTGIVSKLLHMSSNVSTPGSDVIVFFDSNRLYKIPTARSLTSELHTGGERISTEIALYLGSDTRQANGYCGPLIGSHRSIRDLINLREAERMAPIVHFWTISARRSYARTARPTAIIFGVQTHRKGRCRQPAVCCTHSVCCEDTALAIRRCTTSAEPR